MWNQPNRIRLLVERDVQWSLIGRATLYAAACLVYFTTIEFFNQSRLHPTARPVDVLTTLSLEAVFWLPGLLVLMPLMIYDTLRHSNRIAGPVFSLRRQLRSLADDEPSQPLSFRGDDYWLELAEDFNRLREELQTLRNERRDTPSTESQAT